MDSDDANLITHNCYLLGDYGGQYNIRMEEDEPACLVGKVRTQTIRQIFKDLSPKNLKGVEFFFLICAG